MMPSPQTLTKIVFCIENLILVICSVGVLSLSTYFMILVWYVHGVHCGLFILAVIVAIIVALQSLMALVSVLTGKGQATSLTCFIGMCIYLFCFYVAVTVYAAEKIAELDDHVERKLYDMLKDKKSCLREVEQRFSCCGVKSDQDWKNEEETGMCASKNNGSGCAEIIAKELKWVTTAVYSLGMVCSILLPPVTVKAYILLCTYDLKQ